MYDKKLTPKQKNIAKAAPPYNKINGKDFTALRSSNDDKFKGFSDNKNTRPVKTSY